MASIILTGIALVVLGTLAGRNAAKQPVRVPVPVRAKTRSARR